MDNSKQSSGQPEQTVSKKATELLLSKSKKLIEESHALKEKIDKSLKDVDTFLHKDDHKG